MDAIPVIASNSLSSWWDGFRYLTDAVDVIQEGYEEATASCLICHAGLNRVATQVYVIRDCRPFSLHGCCEQLVHLEEKFYEVGNVFKPLQFCETHEENWKGEGSVRLDYDGPSDSPGRSFAEPKTMLAHIAVTCDIKLDDDVTRPRSLHFGTLILAGPHAKVLFRKSQVNDFTLSTSMLSSSSFFVVVDPCSGSRSTPHTTCSPLSPYRSCAGSMYLDCTFPVRSAPRISFACKRTLLNVPIYQVAHPSLSKWLWQEPSTDFMRYPISCFGVRFQNAAQTATRCKFD